MFCIQNATAQSSDEEDDNNVNIASLAQADPVNDSDNGSFQTDSGLEAEDGEDEEMELEVEIHVDERDDDDLDLDIEDG